MNNLSKNSKILLYIFAASGTIWLGSYITRLSSFYHMFQPEEFILQPFVTNENMTGIFQTLVATVTINLILYILMFVSFLIFVATSKLNLKQNGWLFISTVLILLTAPFELYLLTIDYKIFLIVFNGSFNPQQVLDLVIKRFTVLSSFPIVEILSYLAVLYLFIFQPLTGTKRRLA